ncbi:Fc receptor-like A [Halichoeres trimaculatus]|uniref:Fc receptor-like A n=1 Tax=Halichoeres trimaculatus TaxID=147232 RepID=UPI003D9F85F0
MNETIQKCSNDTMTLTVTCTIEFAYEPDSGEYWCEGEGGSKSNIVYISVTSGSVILESPVFPLRGGDSLTLHCKTRFQDSTNFTADFYRNGVLLKSSNTGHMTIGSVNKSDEGLYKCEIAPDGMSPESWVVVRGRDVIMESPVVPVIEGEAVTLRCRKRNSPYLRADFYKDGMLISSSSAGEMTIPSVSKSDKGLYKCYISGSGESAERHLVVKGETNSQKLRLFLTF